MPAAKLSGALAWKPLGSYWREPFQRPTTGARVAWGCLAEAHAASLPKGACREALSWFFSDNFPLGVRLALVSVPGQDRLTPPQDLALPCFALLCLALARFALLCLYPRRC